MKRRTDAITITALPGSYAAMAIAFGQAGAIPPRRRSRSRWVRRALMLGAVAVAAATFGTAGLFGSIGASLAYFSDQDTTTANSFSTATLDLAVSPSTALLTLANMQPGDSVTGTLTVSNSGTTELRYAITSSATDPDLKGLRTVLQLTIKTVGTSCAVFDGTSLYSGSIASAAVGNPATGTQGGERTLANGASEQLCFRASLPGETGNAYQNAATVATFTFAAEQTANNP